MIYMTSLAITPPGTGECVMTSHYDPAAGHSITIDRADPVILINDELLRGAFTADPPWPHTQVRLAEIIPSEDIYLGATLRITGSNRTVVYHITRHHNEYTYVGEWPD